MKTSLCALVLAMQLSVVGCVTGCEEREFEYKDQCFRVGYGDGPNYISVWYENWCTGTQKYGGIGYFDENGDWENVEEE